MGNIILCSGGCSQGYDRFAEKLAKELGFGILTFHPNWKKHGSSAGFVRNTHIANFSDILIARLEDSGSKGTKDTVDKFRKLNKPNLILVCDDRIETPKDIW